MLNSNTKQDSLLCPPSIYRNSLVQSELNFFYLQKRQKSQKFKSKLSLWHLPPFTPAPQPSPKSLLQPRLQFKPTDSSILESFPIVTFQDNPDFLMKLKKKMLQDFYCSFLTLHFCLGRRNGYEVHKNKKVDPLIHGKKRLGTHCATSCTINEQLLRAP